MQRRSMNYPPVIVPAYSREYALRRLLKSLNEAEYPNDVVQLIITIDGGAPKGVVEAAREFEFKHGSKSIVLRENNLGLTQHILWCGDQTQKYGSAIILEDDLMVDRHFYSYACSALHFYRGDKRIAGIGLHSPRQNQMAKVGFEPMYNGFSAYFMQKVCTWGQAWTADQWENFRRWYSSYDRSKWADRPEIPQRIKTWPTWDNPFSVYMIEKGLYFTYPYIGYTTNCADPGGVHMTDGTDMHQVPLGAKNRPKEEFRFCEFENSRVIYDAFLEPVSPELYEAVGLMPAELEVDFNGIKPMSLLRKKKYAITSKKCSDPLKTYKLSFRPVEKTVLFAVNNSNEDLLGYSEHIYLTNVENIISEKRPYFEQINYYSYYQMENKYFFRRYVLNQLLKYIPF